jgi:hypothetical protein
MAPVPNEAEEKIGDVNGLLREWSDARAQMWTYSASHATLEVRLEKESNLGNAHLVCIDCHRIEGATLLPMATFEVVASTNISLGRYLVQELGGRLRVYCNLVHTRRNVEPVYGRLGE